MPGRRQMIVHIQKISEICKCVPIFVITRLAGFKILHDSMQIRERFKVLETSNEDK